jgi:uncharacterized damage-inducible protein DinB
VTTRDSNDFRFPNGSFHRPQVPLDAAIRASLIGEIERMPAAMRDLVGGLSDAQLDTPYRPGGWTVRQVVHHVPDSHMNAYVRMKLAVTEVEPAIKAYEEARWAELPEARTAPVALSLDLLDALHRRWCAFLRTLPDSEFQKTYRHPEMGVVPVDVALALYAWHGKHHIAHVRSVVSR